MVHYTINDQCLTIFDSAFVPKYRFVRELVAIRNLHGERPIFQRSLDSLRYEWAAHNALYGLGIAKSRTKDVDLEYPQSFFWKLVYGVFGRLVWLFIP